MSIGSCNYYWLELFFAKGNIYMDYICLSVFLYFGYISVAYNYTVVHAMVKGGIVFPLFLASAGPNKYRLLIL